MGNCTILLSSKNSQILLDPYFNNYGNLFYKRTSPVSPYYKSIKHLDAILLSHAHFDHTDIIFLNKFKNKCPIYSPKLSLKPLIFKSKWINKGDEFNIGDFSITVVQANHICPAVGYIIRAEGSTIYFSGDTYYGKFIKSISEKFTIDIAMLTVTRYLLPMTMGEKGSLQCLKDLKPKYFIPIHQDIAQRFQPNSKISYSRLNNKLMQENLPTKIVKLNNGDVFNI
jgi:L-ascorbate metabolism protein UlaG (beta-lactamase superfamily)